MAKLNQSKDVVSYFGPNTTIEGELHANGDVHIDGKLTGSIVCNGDLIIGETGKINGQIKAKNVYVSGNFNGDIEALELLEVHATGYVEGDVKGARLNIHEGGIYKGKVNMDVIASQSIYEGAFQVINK
ncbi:MAG: bactofilin family protein [Candidatus Marinamargulisbacteria bacterium]